jgi:hypothetical protein
MERAGLDPQQRNLALIGAASTALLVYGRAKWWDQGFAGGLKSSGEGWFGRGTSAITPASATCSSPRRTASTL